MRVCLRVRTRGRVKMVSILVTEGAGTVIKGDRVRWCEGLEGTVLGVWKNLVMIETDDGITRLAGERYVTLAHNAPTPRGREDRLWI